MSPVRHENLALEGEAAIREHSWCRLRLPGLTQTGHLSVDGHQQPANVNSFPITRLEGRVSMAEERVQRRFAAIRAADVVGYPC